MSRFRWTIAATALFVAPLPAQQHYERQSGVDVEHYAWSVTLSDSTDEISGDATITVRFVAAGLGSIFFDLNNTGSTGRRGMIVTGVWADSAPAAYTHAANRVTITLPQASRAGAVERFRISYHGFPSEIAVNDGRSGSGRGAGGATSGGRAAGAARGGGAGRGALAGRGSGLWIGKNQFGERAFFSRNWPEGARSWLPCIDHPSDKATSEFFVTAPARYTVVANGLLQEEISLGDGRRLTHWKQSVPIATWLNNIGVEQFGVHYAGLVKGVELSTWAPHQQIDSAVASLELAAREAIEFYSEHVGPYAYEKMASVAAAGGGGGMEHASAIFYGETSANGKPAAALVAHETAHQWFGDAVTEDEWDDVWLSEGFASYFALLFTEHFSGREAFLAGIQRTRASALAAERQQQKPVVHQNAAGTGPDLTQLQYQKGAMVLQALRGQVGTDDFWKGIQRYYARHRNGNATSDDLRRDMEAASGQDLGWFFAQWLTRADSPVVQGGWSWDPVSRKIVVDLVQVGDAAPFRLSLEIGVTPDSGATRIEKVEFDQARQRFEIAADGPPKAVTLDPNAWLLMDATFAPRRAGSR